MRLAVDGAIVLFGGSIFPLIRVVRGSIFPRRDKYGEDDRTCLYVYYDSQFVVCLFKSYKDLIENAMKTFLKKIRSVRYSIFW